MNIAPDAWQADTEHLRARITRVEAQSEARRLQTLYWQERAQGKTEDLICANLEIETLTARIQAVRDVLDKHDSMHGHPNIPARRIRRALDVSPD